MPLIGLSLFTLGTMGPFLAMGIVSLISGIASIFGP